MRLGKSDIRRKAELAARLNADHMRVQASLGKANRAVRAALEAVLVDVRAYNESAALAEKFAAQVASGLLDELEDKSDRWLESDGGQAARGMVDEWENAEFRRLDEPTLPDLTDYDLLGGGVWADLELDELPEESD